MFAKMLLVKNNTIFRNADLGDIVGVSGTVFKTNVGELSVKANNSDC